MIQEIRIAILVFIIIGLAMWNMSLEKRIEKIEKGIEKSMTSVRVPATPLEVVS